MSSDRDCASVGALYKFSFLVISEDKVVTYDMFLSLWELQENVKRFDLGMLETD